MTEVSERPPASRRTEPVARALAELGLAARRFAFLTVMPSLTLIGLILLLVLGGAPRHPPELSRAFHSIGRLSFVQILAILGVAIITGAVVNSLQFSIVQVLEGYWGASALGVRMSRTATRRYEDLYVRLTEALDDLAGQPASWDIDREESIYAAARSRLPEPDRLLPTRLGNTLRRAEDLAGDRYGLNAVLVIPRLFPSLPPSLAQRISDARFQLDLGVRYCMIWLLATVGALFLLLSFPGWLFVAVGTYVAAWLSYRAACGAAASYGAMLAVAIDLHRFDLLAVLRQELPESLPDEVANNTVLMNVMAGRIRSRGRLPPVRYRHPSAAAGKDAANRPDGPT